MTVLVAVGAIAWTGNALDVAAGSDAGGHRTTLKAAGLKVMHLGCVRKSDGELRYIAVAADCHARVVRFPKDGPVTVCQIDKESSQPLRRKGSLFVVGGAGQCHGPKYPKSHAQTLPAPKELKLCARKGNGSVRVVSDFSKCGARERLVRLKKRLPNHPPHATSRSVTVPENTPTPITLGGSDPDGGGLRFNITSRPAHGTLSGRAPNVRYTPNINYTGTDSFTFRARDRWGASDLGLVTITVTPGNEAPVLVASSGSTGYFEADSPTPIDPALTVSDSDDAFLEGATVRVSSGFQTGDSLTFDAQNGIVGTYNSGTGVLTLTGTASVSDYQTALRSVGFQSSNDNPRTLKTVAFRASDGAVASAPAAKQVSVTPINDPPELTTTSGALYYPRGSGPKPIDPGLTLTDPDSSIGGATVQITGNFSSADDELALPAQAGISGSYNYATGVLTLSGTASVTAYRAALRSVTYNTQTSPYEPKQVAFKATDSHGSDSNLAYRIINVGS